MKYINWTLAFNGLKLFNDSTTIQLIWLIIVEFLNLLNVICFMLYQTPIDLQWFLYFLTPMITIILRLYIYARNQRICRLLLAMDRLLLNTQRETLRKSCSRYAIGYLLIWLIYVGFNILYTLVGSTIQKSWLPNGLVDESNWFKSAIAIVFIVADTLYMLPTICLTCALYLTMVTVVNEVSRSYFTACHQTGQIVDNIKKADSQVQVYDEFGRLFGLLPVTWCIFIYVQTIGTILTIFYMTSLSDDTLKTLLYFLIPLIAGCGYFTVILWLAAKMADDLRKERLALIRKLCIQSMANDNMNSLIRLINTIDFELTGNGLFTIEKTMFLNMFGQMITMSVLFAQITA